MQVQEQERRAAIHEAGHAVAAVAFRIRFDSVDLVPEQLPDGTVRLGGVRTRPYNMSVHKYERYVIHLLAGRVAEYIMLHGLTDPEIIAQRFLKEFDLDHHHEDAFRARQTLAEIEWAHPCSCEVTYELYRYIKATVRILRKPKHLAPIEIVAQELLRRPSISQAEVKRLLGRQ